MPISIHGLRARERPGGLVEPPVDLAGVTELRVHGVGGTTPEHLLADQSPEQVAGNAIAGFYRTDDLGPVDASESSIGARTTSRHVEAYSWGGTTSKSSSRVLWLLLLPFMLVNIAGWSCSTKMKESPLFGWHQRVMRVVCLALTLNVVLVVSFITADLCAYQAPRAGALGHKWWLWGLRWAPIAGHPGRSLVMGFAVPIALVIFLARLGTTTADKYEKVRPPVQDTDDNKRPVGYASTHSIHEREFFDGEYAVRYAMWLHIAAATAFVSILFATTAHAATATPTHQAGWWWIAIVLGVSVLVAAVMMLVFWERVTEHNARVARNLATLALLAVICAGIYSWVQPAYSVARPQLPGFGTAMLWSFAAFLAVVVILALVELSKTFGGTHGRVFAWAPPLITLVAFGLLNTVLFSTAFVVAHNLGTVAFDAKHVGIGAIYLSPKLGWITPGLVLAIVLAVIVFLAVEAACLFRQKEHVDTIRKTYESDTDAWQTQRTAAPALQQAWMENALQPPVDERWARTVSIWRWICNAPLDAPLLIWLVLAVQALVVAFALADQAPLPHQLYAPGTVWAKAFVGVATAAPLLLMAQLRAGWKSPSRRKGIGIIWDVGTFWPRAYHPLAPPSYAERAVPDLQRRIWWLHDNGGKTLIAAHSQGTILAATALLQTKCRAGNDTVALVTFGSPLCKLFHWAFPAYFSPQVLAPLAPFAGGNARVCVWHNFHYPTDAIAGAVFAGANPVDIELLDPATAAYIYQQDKPAVGGHSGYWTDGRVWRDVDQIADAL
jgi:hypothetical protein